MLTEFAAMLRGTALTEPSIDDTLETLSPTLADPLTNTLVVNYLLLRAFYRWETVLGALSSATDSWMVYSSILFLCLLISFDLNLCSRFTTYFTVRVHNYSTGFVPSCWLSFT